MASPKLKQFQVTRTPKIKDSRDQYVHRGDICHLTKPLAEHYHKLGYIRVTMDRLFDDQAGDDGADDGADAATDDSGPDDAKPAAAVGASDEAKPSSNASPDIGTSTSETGGGRISNRRRKRITG